MQEHTDGEYVWDEQAKRSTFWCAIANTKNNIYDLLTSKNVKKLVHVVAPGGSIEEMGGTPGAPGYCFMHTITTISGGGNHRVRQSTRVTTYTLREVSVGKVVWDTSTNISTTAAFGSVDGILDFTEYIIAPEPDGNGRTLVGVSSKFNFNDLNNNSLKCILCCGTCCFFPCAWAATKKYMKAAAMGPILRVRDALNSHQAEPVALLTGTLVTGTLAHVAPICNTMPERSANKVTPPVCLEPSVAMERLGQLKSLLDAGAISEEEFNLKRGPLLDAM
jgi:hypothetical protein